MADGEGIEGWKEERSGKGRGGKDLRWWQRKALEPRKEMRPVK